MCIGIRDLTLSKNLRKSSIFATVPFFDRRLCLFFRLEYKTHSVTVIETVNIQRFRTPYIHAVARIEAEQHPDIRDF